MYTTKSYQVAALPGEGIGPEVVEASLSVLRKVAEISGFSLNVIHGLIGDPAFKSLGSFFPTETAKICESADGILFGAVSRGGILELRKHFDFFANLRPVKPIASLLSKSSLQPTKIEEVDILFVRELVSGIYFGHSGRSQDTQGDYGFHTMQYHDWEIRRIAKVGLTKAQKRRKHLTVAHKENALPHLPWCEIVKEEAQNFADVKVETMLVDNLAMQLVKKPQHFDVILAGNLFGDILSDIGGALVGSIGLLSSASLNEKGFGLYEAIHGTAPDIAGKDMANPLGTLGAVILMLQQWGEFDAANLVIKAQTQVLEKGYRTPDLYSQHPEIRVGTKAFSNLLIQELSSSIR